MASRNWLDEEKAQRVIRFVAHLYRAIGLELPAYQQDLIRELYGRSKPNGLRQYQHCYFSVPRKNAKSTLVAALSLYHLTADGEANPRIYFAATSLDQTRETFEIAANMCSAVPFLDKNIVIRDSRNSKEMSYYRAGSKLGYVQALTRGGSKEGKNPSVVIYDELCDWKEVDRPLWTSMRTGSLARKQPLWLITTTAGNQNEGICWEQYLYAKKVESGQIEDETFLPYIVEADASRLDDPDEWARVNPLVREGFIPRENLESMHAGVKASEHELAKFRRKHLNVWVGSSFAYLNMDAWNRQTATIEDADLIGLPMVAAFDLSQRTDFTSLMLLFWRQQGEKVTYYLKPYFWLPSEGLRARQEADGMPYQRWVDQGFIELSPGPTIDYHLVLDRLKTLSVTYRVKEIAYDPWNAEHLVQDLDRAGYTLSPVRQGFVSMTAPMKALQAAVLDGAVVHGCNPVLSWQAGQLMAKEDATGNVKPLKAGRKNKIDGMVALIMALGLAMRHQHAGKYKSSLQWFFSEGN